MQFENNQGLVWNTVREERGQSKGAMRAQIDPPIQYSPQISKKLHPLPQNLVSYCLKFDWADFQLCRISF